MLLLLIFIYLFFKLNLFSLFLFYDHHPPPLPLLHRFKIILGIFHLLFWIVLRSFFFVFILPLLLPPLTSDTIITTQWQFILIMKNNNSLSLPRRPFMMWLLLISIPFHPNSCLSSITIGCPDFSFLSEMLSSMTLTSQPNVSHVFSLLINFIGSVIELGAPLLTIFKINTSNVGSKIKMTLVRMS